MDTLNTSDTFKFLGFSLGNEVFAIAVNNVIEVIRNKDLTSIPKTAEYITGVINFRGEILSVVSARKKLNIPSNKNTDEQIIIVIEFEQQNVHSKLGLIADKVIGVLNIKENEIQPVLEFGNYYNPEFLKGAFKYKEEILTILDVEKIFNEDEISIINKTTKIKTQKK